MIIHHNFPSYSLWYQQLKILITKDIIKENDVKIILSLQIWTFIHDTRIDSWYSLLYWKLLQLHINNTTWDLWYSRDEYIQHNHFNSEQNDLIELLFLSKIKMLVQRVEHNGKTLLVHWKAKLEVVNGTGNTETMI